jgi:hypothetical protein
MSTGSTEDLEVGVCTEEVLIVDWTWGGESGLSPVTRVDECWNNKLSDLIRLSKRETA